MLGKQSIADHHVCGLIAGMANLITRHIFSFIPGSSREGRVCMLLAFGMSGRECSSLQEWALGRRQLI